MASPPAVLIAAGGTGGHIFPGLALAAAIRRQDEETSVSFLGTRRGLERTIVAGHGYPLRLVDVRPLPRRLGVGPVLAGLSLVRATAQARRLIRAERISVVAGMGGYVSLPAVAGARTTGVPSIIHESGAVPGLSNRVAARLTPNVAVAFEEAARRLPRARHIGMPLDPAIARLDRDALRGEGRAAFGLPPDAGVLLVLGGSLGAMRLNEVGIGLAARWRERDDLRIVLKAGGGHLAAVDRELAALEAEEVVRSLAFIDRMDLAYAAADVALCRAGAGTVAELAAAGLPSIIVPYPHATGDHQTKNALPLTSAGAAVLVPDREADVRRIGPLAEELLRDHERRSRMEKAARALARPDAADELAAWVLSLARDRGG